MNYTVENSQTVRDLIWDSFEKHACSPAVGIVDGERFSYREIREQTEHLSFHFLQKGIVKGDKVAILGPNSPSWVVAYFSLLSLGVVAVPILPDFHTDEIVFVLKHAGVKAILASRRQLIRLDQETIRAIPIIMNLEDFSTLTDADHPEKDSSWTEYKPQGSHDPFTMPVDPEDLATIIYTSGTTGFSKGVMLTNSNLVTNIRQCNNIEPIQDTDVFLSILPLSHSYENTVGLLLPITHGAAIQYIEKPPTAAVLVPALKKVRPTHMLSVPLVIEKIYNSQIRGKIDKSAFLRFFYRISPFRKFFNRMAGKKLMATFGGKIRFFGIGGAKLDAATDRFLQEARFPYAIGYGLTETAPLLAGTNASEVRYQSTGRPVEGVELIIHDPDPESGIGEIWARGKNVMKGYYNESLITSKVLLPDGWFRTGDLGLFDREGFLFIKGRLKNVIIGASGENIYPEEIESVINRFEYVLESVVVEQKGKLIALVHFNFEELEKQFRHFKDEARQHLEKKIEEMTAELQQFVNAKVNKFSRIQAIIVQYEPFEKTATKKIKRYLYQG